MDIHVLKTEILNGNIDKVREICTNKIPVKLRYAVYNCLLSSTLEQQAKVNTIHASDKIIQMDVLRTRQNDPWFTLESTKTLLEHSLRSYCLQNAIHYKQGMNEIMAILFVMANECQEVLPVLEVEGMFSSFVKAFLPSMYNDTEFRSLQCLLSMYRKILLYHDPILCHYLDQHDVQPELYATQWFMTLFARQKMVNVVLHLWDKLLLLEGNNGACYLPYLVYALIVSHRDEIVKSDPIELFQTMSNFGLETIDQVDRIWSLATKTMQETPQCFTKNIQTISQFVNVSEEQLYKSESAICLSIDGHEIFRKQAITYIVLDCRPKDDFEQQHLQTSFHLDPELLANPEALEAILLGFENMKGHHLCFVGQAPTRRTLGRIITMTQHILQVDVQVARFILLFLQRGFQFISLVYDGFPSIVESGQLDDFSSDGTKSTMPLSMEYITKGALHIKERIRSLSEDSMNSAKQYMHEDSPTRAKQIRFFTNIEQTLTEKLEQSKGLLASAAKLHISPQFIPSSANSKDVELDGESIGLLLRAYKSKEKAGKKVIMVDSVIPNGVAAKSKRIHRGDILLEINGQNISSFNFEQVNETLSTAARPLILKLAPSMLQKCISIDVVSSSPDPPWFAGSTKDALCIAWESKEGASCYQVQFSERSNHQWNPWRTLATISNTDALEQEILTSGTIMGLPSNAQFVFRVRCKIDIAWSPYSLSSMAMTTPSSECTSSEPTKIKFQSGGCSDTSQKGHFMYRVCIPLALRKEPHMNAMRLDVNGALEKGEIIHCCERLLRPGSNQVFVRIESRNAWAFENTSDGAMVLQRISELPHSVFTWSSASDLHFPTLSAPTLLPCSSDALLVTWALPNLPSTERILKFELQQSKSSRLSRWTTVNAQLDAALDHFMLSKLCHGTSYVVRYRCCIQNIATRQSKWTNYSPTSTAVQTMARDIIDILDGKSKHNPNTS